MERFVQAANTLLLRAEVGERFLLFRGDGDERGRGFELVEELARIFQILMRETLVLEGP